MRVGSIVDQHRAWKISNEKCAQLLRETFDPKVDEVDSTPEHSSQGLVLANVQSKKLNGLSETIERGAKVVLMGSNGAGKTTLLSTIAGMEEYQAGMIRFDGAIPKRENICYVGASSPVLKGSIRKAMTMGRSAPAER